MTKWFEQQDTFDGQTPHKPRSTETPRRSNWRCDFADGSKFSATVEGDDKKSKLVLAHTAIPTKQEANDWKKYWKDVTAQIV